MSYPPKGKADYLALGDYNAECYECGRKFKASTMRRQWQGYWVCAEHWTPRQPQDFVRGVPDRQVPGWVQPQPANIFAQFCTANGQSAVPGQMEPGCIVPGYLSPSYDPDGD